MLELVLIKFPAKLDKPSQTFENIHVQGWSFTKPPKEKFRPNFISANPLTVSIEQV